MAINEIAEENIPDDMPQLLDSKADNEKCLVHLGGHKESTKIFTDILYSQMNGDGITIESNQKNDKTNKMFSPFENDKPTNILTERLIGNKMLLNSDWSGKKAGSSSSAEDNSMESDAVDIGHSQKTVQSDNEIEATNLRQNSIQTKSLESSSVSCPICKIGDDDFKNKLIHFFVKFFKNEKFEEENLWPQNEKAAKKRALSLDDQIAPTSTETKINKGNCREPSSRTIRLGLSRRVKLQPLHQKQVENSRKQNSCTVTE